jgi:hypothetical protein
MRALPIAFEVCARLSSSAYFCRRIAVTGRRRFNVHRRHRMCTPLRRVEEHHGAFASGVAQGLITSSVLAEHGDLVVPIEIADSTFPLIRTQWHGADGAAGCCGASSQRIAN